MSEYLARLVDPSGFPPRWQCGAGWTAELGWTHILSDLGVWSAYLAIPVVLGYFALRRRNIPFRGVFLLFGAFILLCGTTHLLEAVIFWHPVYRLSGAVKLLTAGVSWWTVLALVKVIPQALALRDPAELEREVARRAQAEDALRRAHDDLDGRVRERTADLGRANDALRASEQQFRQLADTIPQLAWTARPDGHIDWYNRRWYEYTGTTPQSMEGWGWQAVHDPAELPRVLERWAGSIASGQPFDMVFPIKGSDGVFRPFLTQVSPLKGDDGRVARWFGTNTDISEQRRSHDELERKVRERTAELDRSNQELQNFASVASHDLQEPLRKIQAFGDLLLGECAAELPDAGRDYVGRMNASATRMRALIEDLLTLARVTSQARPLVPVDLGRVAREVVADLDLLARRAGGLVEVGDLPTVDADPTQMRQLLQNLIGNALKFHRPGEPPVVRVDARAGPGPWCEVRVRDNGVGFDPKYVDRIFEVFQRLHGRDRYDGTGIGLAVCRRVAERHGGTITADSAPGAGSTFTVTLPLTRPRADDRP